MELSSLSALSPIDGRYHGKTSELSPYFSEYGLIRYRVRVEIEYFIALSRFGLPELTGIESDQFTALQTIVDDFTQKDAERIKEIEKTTNHDVKAVEYFIADRKNADSIQRPSRWRGWPCGIPGNYSRAGFSAERTG